MPINRLINSFLDAFIRREGKGRLLQTGVSTLRGLAKQPWTLPLIARYIESETFWIGSKKNTKNRIRLLVLNEERYRADLAVLADHPEVELIGLPSKVQHLVNSVWISELREISKKNPDAYIQNTDPRVRKARDALTFFLRSLLIILQRRLGIDGLITCTFYYRQDRDWEVAATALNIPFFILHKENMKDRVIHEKSIKRYQEKHFQYVGKRIFLFNELEKEVLLSAGVCDESVISVVGGLRMDAIHKKVSEGRVGEPGREVVLFSFHHCIGLLKIPNVYGFFSPDRKVGFVDYFDKVHAAIAQFADANPDIKVIIKPKWEQGWADQIRSAIQRVSGLNANEIPNLIITADIPAQELIERASVVVGINSTTLLEAKLFGRRVVVPLFAEALDKYYDDHVYFHDYMDVFNVATSPDDLKQSIWMNWRGIHRFEKCRRK